MIGSLCNKLNKEFPNKILTIITTDTDMTIHSYPNDLILLRPK